MSVGLSNMETTGHSDMHKILARVGFRGAPLQRTTRMRWEPVGVQRKILGGGCALLSQGEKSQHVCIKVTVIQLQRQWSWEQKRDKNVSGSEIYYCNLQNNKISSCSNGGVLLFHVQWL